MALHLARLKLGDLQFQNKNKVMLKEEEEELAKKSCIYTN